MTLRIFSSLSFYWIMKWAMYMCLATETREKEAGVRNETINKPAQDSPLLSAFLLWHMLVFFRVQHIEFDCFGCSCSRFLAPVLASGVPGRVHPLPRSQAQPRGAHQHRLPSEKLVFCQGHGGNRVSGEVAGLPTPTGSVKEVGGTKEIWKAKADAQSLV